MRRRLSEPEFGIKAIQHVFAVCLSILLAEALDLRRIALSRNVVSAEPARAGSSFANSCRRMSPRRKNERRSYIAQAESCLLQ